MLCMCLTFVETIQGFSSFQFLHETGRMMSEKGGESESSKNIFELSVINSDYSYSLFHFRELSAEKCFSIRLKLFCFLTGHAWLY